MHKHHPELAALPFIYLALPAICIASGNSKSQVYSLIKAGRFPPGELISSQSRRWKSTDIAAWLVEQSEKAEQREAALAAPLKQKARKAAASFVANRAVAKEAQREAS